MNYFKSSIGRKHFMGLTGLALSLFVLVHMAGNLQLLVGREAYNHYSYVLLTNPFIYVAEAGLALLFIIHILTGIWLTKENRQARPHGYWRGTNGEKGVCPASKTMPFTGIALLAFTVWHLIHFKYGEYIADTNVYFWAIPGHEVRDIYALVIKAFTDPVQLTLYVVAMLILGFHLSHGFWSAFQSIGVYHPRYTPVLKVTGYFFSAIVAFGFIIPPVLIFIGRIQ